MTTLQILNPAVNNTDAFKALKTGQAALRRFAKIQTGGAAVVINPIFRTRVPDMFIHRLDPSSFVQPFAALASDTPIDFKKAMDLFTKVDSFVIKAWLFCATEDGLITNELAFSHHGISIDGKVTLQSSLMEALSNGERFAPRALKEKRDYCFGKNAGVLLTGEGWEGTVAKYNVGAEIWRQLPEVTDNVLEYQDERYFKGSCNSEKFLKELDRLLIDQDNFLFAGVVQPALSPIISEAAIACNGGNSFGWRLELEPGAPLILEKIGHLVSESHERG